MDQREHVGRGRFEALGLDAENPVAVVRPHAFIGPQIARTAAELRDLLGAPEPLFALGKGGSGMRKFRSLMFKTAGLGGEGPEQERETERRRQGADPDVN